MPFPMMTDVYAKPSPLTAQVFPSFPEAQVSRSTVDFVRRTINSAGIGVISSPVRLLPACWRHFPTAQNNAITDVPGLKVGHVSVTREWPSRIRTGVTAIVPDAAALTTHWHGENGLPGQPGNLANTGFRAAGVTLNGNGELTGIGPLTTAGILNSPIILTNTYAVGLAHDGVFRWFAHRHPGEWPGQLPVVGECWDGFYSIIDDPVLTPGDTVAAIDAACSGPVLQGRTGAGTGMRSFELHAGIGSASRKVVLNGREYTIGVLVNANHSRLESLNPLLRAALEQHWKRPVQQVRQMDNADQAVRPTQSQAAPPTSRQGSIITIIATDLPLDSKALHQLAERAGLGIGNTGSTMATTSGDFAVAFSTANPVPLGAEAPDLVPATSVHPDALSPILQATVEAVTEAQLNAITAAHTNLAPQVPSKL
jgi:L-aminopeptidase/D-esterase-like protein